MNKKYDAFLSHNSQDKPIVEEIAHWLEDKANRSVWLDEWNLIPGDPWQEELEKALDASKCCVVFLGPNGIGAWQNEEMRTCLEEKVSSKTIRVVPVLLPGAVRPEQESKLPRFLKRLGWVTFCKDWQESEALHCLKCGIKGIAPGRDARKNKTDFRPSRSLDKKKSIPKENERYIWQEADNSCAICGDRDIVTQDKHHIEFVSKGGGNETDNLILVCSNCHRKIHAGVISESEIKDRKAWLTIRLRQPTGYCLLDKTFFENEGQKGESRILHLRMATWSFILKGNYIDRDQQDKLLSSAEELKTFTGDSLLIIRGEPGGGKSALMRWLAYQLYLKGNTVLHMTGLHDDWRERIGKFSERREKKHFYVIADDIFRTEVILEALKAGGNYIAFTFIGTTRSNEDRHSDLEGLGYEISCLDVEPLSKNEKQRILKKLEQDVDYADKITQLSAEQKQHFLNAPSMLVLMLQLSEGKPFHLIIEDVVMRLADIKENPARQIFGVLCNFYKFGIFVPEEILMLCLSGFERSFILKVIDRAEHGSGDLAGLIDRIWGLGYEGLSTGHEIIAAKAVGLGSISKRSDYPYSPHDLYDYLCSIIQKLDVQDEIHKRWLSFTFWALVLNGEIKLVKGLLKTYSQEIERLCEAGNITIKYRWQRVYGTIEQYDDQQRLIEQILLSDPQNSTEWIFWMKLFELYSTEEQKRNVWMRIEKWLKDCIDFAVSFLSLIERYGTKKQKQEAIMKTQKWLEKYSEATYVRTKYLGLVEVYGTEDEKRQAMGETQKWLDKHSEATDVRVKYLALVEVYGTEDEKRQTIAETNRWLEKHPEDTYVRTKYLVLVEVYGTKNEKRQAIEETCKWLEMYTEDTHVRAKYISLVEVYGTKGEKCQTIGKKGTVGAIVRM